ELEEENYHLRSELQTEVDINRQNERRINQLEQDYARCEQEIQNLNREIERLENASEEEIVELKSEISSLKSQLYQAKKDVRDKEKYISTLEEQLILDTYESANPFPDTLTREEIMRVVAKAYGPPPKPQKPEKLQSSRIDRLESKIDEIGYH
ncbi:222_t:CDS:2, partial [Funneliformis geosporum]